MQALQKSFANQTTMMSKTAVEEVDEVKTMIATNKLNNTKQQTYKQTKTAVKQVDNLKKIQDMWLAQFPLQVPYSYQCRTCSLIQVLPLINPPLKFESRLVYHQKSSSYPQSWRKREPGFRLWPLEKGTKVELQAPQNSEICPVKSLFSNVSILIPHSLCHQFNRWSCSTLLNIKIWESTST